MSRGISKQQRHILIMLGTKLADDRYDTERGWFSTDEIIAEINFDYRLWLLDDGSPFHHGPRSRERAKPHESLRISTHRALQSLERRGLVVSRFHRHSRMWAVPKRVRRKRKLGGGPPFDEMNWVDTPEERARWHKQWQWGWHVRRWPDEKRIRWMLRIPTPEDINEIKREAKEFWGKK